MVFLGLPSVKHFKKYEKGGFLEIFINMYDMGVWQFKIGKSSSFDRMIRRMIVSLYLTDVS